MKVGWKQDSSGICRFHLPGAKPLERVKAGDGKTPTQVKQPTYSGKGSPHLLRWHFAESIALREQSRRIIAMPEFHVGPVATTLARGTRVVGFLQHRTGINDGKARSRIGKQSRRVIALPVVRPDARKRPGSGSPDRLVHPDCKAKVIPAR